MCQQQNQNNMNHASPSRANNETAPTEQSNQPAPPDEQQSPVSDGLVYGPWPEGFYDLGGPYSPGVPDDPEAASPLEFYAPDADDGPQEIIFEPWMTDYYSSMEGYTGNYSLGVYFEPASEESSLPTSPNHLRPHEQLEPDEFLHLLLDRITRTPSPPPRPREAEPGAILVPICPNARSVPFDDEPREHRRRTIVCPAPPRCPVCRGIPPRRSGDSEHSEDPRLCDLHRQQRGE